MPWAPLSSCAWYVVCCAFFFGWYLQSVRQLTLVLHLVHQSLLLLFFVAASCMTSLAILSTFSLRFETSNFFPYYIHSIGAAEGLFFLGSSLAPPLAPVRVEEIYSVSDRQTKSIHEPLLIQSTCRHRLSWVGLRLEARQVLLDSFRCRYGRSLVHDLALILHCSKQIQERLTCTIRSALCV